MKWSSRRTRFVGIGSARSPWINGTGESVDADWKFCVVSSGEGESIRFSLESEDEPGRAVAIDSRTTLMGVGWTDRVLRLENYARLRVVVEWFAPIGIEVDATLSTRHVTK